MVLILLNRMRWLAFCNGWGDYFPNGMRGFAFRKGRDDLFLKMDETIASRKRWDDWMDRIMKR